MSTGSLSSLGLGSSVLTYDVIEQLREADEDSLIKPIDADLEENALKKETLETFMTSMESLLDSANTLSDTSTYLQRKTSITGEGVSGSAGVGFTPQDVKIEVDQLAKGDIYETGTKFESRDSTFSTTNTAMKFFLGDTEYEVDITTGDTLQSVANKITDATNGAAVGLILKTGGDEPYQLMIQSKDTGEDNKIYFGSTSVSNAISSGELDADVAGDLTLTFKDNSGNDVTVDVTMPTTSTDNTSTANAALLKTAIEDAIGADSDLTDLLFDPSATSTIADRNKPIHIGLDPDGTQIIINDTRGYQFTVGGTYAESLGFSTDSVSNTHSVESDSVRSAGLSGSFYVAGTQVDISTASTNTASENAQAVVDAINTALGADYNAEVTGDSSDQIKITNVTDGSDIQIALFGTEGTQDYEDSEDLLTDIGLTLGTHKSYSNALADTFQLDNIQVAQDSEFTFNDIAITRSGNYIDDVLSGLTIELEKVHATGDSSTIRVEQDTDGFVEEVENFVEMYNEVLSQITETTKYDVETGEKGVFNGNSDILRVRSDLNTILTFNTVDGDSLFDFGMFLEEDGTVTLDKEQLVEKINSDFAATESFFRGSLSTQNGQEVEIDGIFKQFRTTLEATVDQTNSSLKLYEGTLNTEYDKLIEERQENVDLLDTRYAIMANQFAAYDSIIAGINNNFQSMQMMINQQINGNS